MVTVFLVFLTDVCCCKYDLFFSSCVPLAQTGRVEGNGVCAFADLLQLSAVKVSKIIMLILIMFAKNHVTYVADLFMFLDVK
jgi:hypothetical protein